MRHLARSWKHDFRWLRHCYRNNRHDQWWKELRKRCLRMAKRADRQEARRQIEKETHEADT